VRTERGKILLRSVSFSAYHQICMSTTGDLAQQRDDAWRVIGHDWAVQRLNSAISRGQLAQSHLFVGPQGIGKATLARAAARMLIGRDERARKLIDAGRHPDLSWLAPEGDSIKIDAVRELLRTLNLAPVEATHRVAIIDQVQTMHDTAKNVLLKTLEEPNPRVIMILIAPSVESVLATISSRCQVLNLRPVTMSAVQAALVARGTAPERAAQLARLARGRVGWALNALADETLLESRVERVDQLRMLLSAGATERFAFSEKLAKRDGDEIRALLDEWLLFWRDVGQLAGGAADAPLRNTDQAPWLRSVAEAVNPSIVHAQMKALTHAAQRIDQNVNARLTLDALLLHLPKA
jgi:DNA polymerase III subunit delta'